MKNTVGTAFRQYSALADKVANMENIKIVRILAVAGAVLLTAAACAPTVQLAAPEKPIEINLNINIKHEILVKVEQEVEDLFEEEEELF
jgi:hypothetical protein